MRHGRFCLALTISAMLGWAVILAAQPLKKPVAAPPMAEAEEPPPEEVKEKAIAERFQKVLETNPRRGTALDRLYGYHVERGTLDRLIGSYADRTKKNAKDGTAWMIIGLLESQRGKDAAAVAAFRQAEANLSTNAMAPYYLGQSLVLVGQPETAAEAFERAITRKPIRNDLLDIFQALGRVYQRAQRTDKALDVWNRLEKLFPDDARVQEQIATTLVEEGQFEQALPRLQKLASTTDDKYRQSMLRMDVAELKVKLKKSAEALADFEKLLAELNSDSWLHRDVRRRIEEVFLRGDDLAGLAKYYEKWLEKNPTDVDAFARLAKNLSSQGRAPEAKAWLEKGLVAAPTNRALRQGLIDQLVFEQNFAAAALQYETLAKSDPNNPDTLREWGKMLMRDPAKPEAERRMAAAAVWKRLLERKPNDPVTNSQVADLMRTAGAADEAIALYKKAIALAPEAAQYREYLGEYFHSLMRSEEALATWRPIAEGANRNAKNLARLAEVFAGFGYRKEAIAAMADAVKLEGDDFGMLMTFAELLYQDGQHDDALKQIAAASARTSNAEEVEQVLVAQIKVYQATDKLVERIESLQKELTANKDATADRWLKLARFFEANRQLDRAAEAISKAGARDPKSVPVLIAGARIFESSGSILAAAETNRKLASLDRRYRTEYLTAVAKLEQRLGRRQEALQAGRDLLAASPGNPEVYKFFAELCFQLGDQEEGLEALRRSVRANPTDPQGLITLANALGERVRQGEAIELLWRALEKTNELEAKLGVIERITQLYLENNQFDRLIERLERERRDSDKPRDMAMVIAQAYTTAGDLGTARAQLERLLAESSRDVNLLGQLVSLCESEGDLAAAVKYQRQIAAAAPNNFDHQLKMAQLLTRTGEADEAAEIWVNLVAKQTETHRNLQAIDQLINGGKFDSALAILSRLLVQKPGNWELLYREGAALAAKGKRDDAAKRFVSILALKQLDDEPGAIAKHDQEKAATKAKAAPRPGQQAYDRSTPPFLRRSNNVWRIRMAVGMDQRDYYPGNQQQSYAPSDFGEARMACLGYLYEQARARNDQDGFVKRLRLARDKAGADLRPLWDWYYFQALRQERKDMLATCLKLSNGPDPAGALAYLNAIGSRDNGVSRRRRGAAEAKDTTPPLPADQLAHALACFENLKRLKPDWVTAEVTQIAMTELKRAKRSEDETAIYKALVADASTIEKIQSALALAAGRKDIESALELFLKLDKLQGPAKTAAALAQLPTREATSQLESLVATLADEKKFPEALRIFDQAIALARRQNLAVPPSTIRKTSQGGGFSGYIPGKNGKNYRMSFPSPSEYYDYHLLQMLYTAYAKYREADLTSDLIAHVRKQAEAAQGAEQMYLRLATGYLLWWNDDKDESIEQLQQAIGLAPNDHNLLMEVATLREELGDPESALALLDSIVPLDTQMMQRREDFALQLAERTGNVDRARRAAERLFGLRLDADKQLVLAGKMHRLGMAKLAETVLNRAQRQAGNKTGTLLQLMSQYQSQNQTDLAVQIARQLLRKGPSMNFNQRGYNEVDNAREQAIRVLARSGQLKEMTERAEAQLKASPKSLQIHQTLVGFYQASNDKEKLKAALQKMAELKPDDGKLRFQVAQQLMQFGDRDAAIAHYKAAIKLDPSSFGNRYWEIEQTFSQANKFEELARLMEEIDFHKIGNYWSVIQMVPSLLRSDKGKELGLKLFKKSWEAFPQYRGQLLSQLSDESVWRLPEIYAYAKEAVIPREDSELDPWQATNEILSWNGDGRIEGVVTRMFSIARKQQRLPELKVEIQAALAKRPEWTGGKAMLAALEIQLGNKDAGKKLWQDAFNSKTEIPPLSRFLLAQELEFYAGVEDVAVATLEGGVEEMMKEGSYDISSNPARRLVWWYQQLGRKDDAKKLQLRMSKVEQNDPGYGGGGYWQYQQVNNKLSAARELQGLGETVEAVRIFNSLLADRESLDQANQYYGGERFDQQIEAGLRDAMASLKPDSLSSALGSLLTPLEGGASSKSALDLVVLVDSREFAKASLNSLFAAAIKSTEKKPEVRREAAAKLADLARKHPKDISIHTAAALVAFADGKPEAIREALDRLVKAVEESPLEPLTGKARANSRQRAEALLQVPLWLAARECLANRKDREPFHAAGEKLAARAVLAAKRQQDSPYLACILREWGQLDLDRGDRAKAEAHWAELLESYLPKPTPKKWAVPVRPAPAPPAPPAVVPAPKAPQSQAPRSADFRYVLAMRPVAVAAPVSPAGPRSGGSTTVLNVDQFQQVYSLAVLAADKGMTELSMKAMRDALRGGPLAPSKQRRNFGGAFRSRMIGGVQYYVQDNGIVQVGVDQALVELVPKWRASKAPLADIYEVVATAVLPDARPAEVFLASEGRVSGTIYSISPSGNLTPAVGINDDGVEDRGLCGLLCDVAIEANKVDDLRRRAGTRIGQPLGELNAQVLLATLALQTKNEAETLQLIKTLGERLKKDSLRGTNDSVMGVLLPLLADPKYAETAAPFIQKAAENCATTGNRQDYQRAMELRLKLATRQLALKNEAAARAQFKAIEKFDNKGGRGELDIHMPLAQEYLKIGWTADALKELALHADRAAVESSSPNPGNRREPTLNSFPLLVRRLYELPAAKRYEALHEWTMPTAGRKALRYYVGVLPSELPPPAFAKLPPLPAGQIVNTMLVLAEAANECGKGQELAGIAAKLAAEKIENAELFQVLVALAQKKGKEAEPQVRAFVESTRKRLTAKEEERITSRYYGEDRSPANVHDSELLVVQLSTADPALAAIGQALISTMLERSQSTHNAQQIPRLVSLQKSLAARLAGAPNALENAVPSHWRPANSRETWFAQDGYLTHGWGDGNGLLAFDTPLAGTFEFSVDVFQGHYTEGHAGYAGVVFEPNRGGVGSSVWAIGRHDQVNKDAPGILNEEFNRMTFQVSPGKVRCLLNGKLFYEDTDPQTTSPWLMLFSGSGRRPVFRNFAISGKPVIPAEVKLTGSSLGGWSPYLYGGVVPGRMALKERADGNAFDRYGDPVQQNPSDKPPKYDWEAKGGEIVGRKLDRADKPIPGCLAYFRPLQTGDSVKYEFFYDPGRTHVHPALGRIAFLLEPDGVQLHWLGNAGEDWTGVAPNNAVADSAARKSDKLPLKAGDWNALSLTTTADGLSIELNGAAIYEGKLPAGVERQFGLFHYREKTGVRVRNAVLRGSWGKELPAIEFTVKGAAPAEANARRSQIGEAYYATESGMIADRARKLPPAERSAALAQWVLPSETRPLIQLAGVIKPLDVLGSVDRADQPTGQRVVLGGRLEAPCLELIAAAKEAGQLNALADRVANLAVPPGDTAFQRSKLALLAAARAAQGRDAEAAAALQSLLAAFKQLPPDADPSVRWPEFIAALATLERPALAKPVRDLAEAINQNANDSMVQNKPFANRDFWVRAYRSVRARAIVAAQPDAIRRPFGSTTFAHWAPIALVDSGGRSQGWNAPHWSFENGVVTHYPGNNEDYLGLRTPLRGDFELTCELRLQGWTEAHMRYGAFQFDLSHDWKKFKMHTAMGHNGRDTTIAPPLKASKTNTYKFRMAVKGGWLRAYVDDRELAAEKIGTEPEPWLMFHANGHCTGTLANVRITGTPTVPEKIDLLSNDSLALWRPYLATGGPWSKRGEELFQFGRKPEPPPEGKPAPPRLFPESALFYQRPMLENGAIEYDFFYDAEKACVHPTLDRLTFLLEPDGVRLHWLTDGHSERSDVPFDNARDEPACRIGPSKLPLKAKAWNRVRLSVIGDEVRIALDGVDVYKRPIEATNQRFFGLFHYTDVSEARIRSMTYSGDWGKAVPPNERLFEPK